MSEDILKRTDGGNAPFNMALASLEKLDRILRDIANVTILAGQEQSAGSSQHVKYRLVRQLYVQAAPLLSDDKLKDWHNQIYGKIKNLSKKLVFAKMYRNEKLSHIEARFSPEVEDALDDLTLEIQGKLSEAGYFMPDRKDPRYALRG